MRRVVPVVFLIASLLTFGLSSFGAHAADPSSGTMTIPSDNKLGERAKLTYTGGPVGGALLLQDTLAQPVCGQTPDQAPPGQCDVFDLHIDMPADYWQKRAGSISGYMEVTIDWTGRPGDTAQDIDLLVTKASGEKLSGGETDNISSGIPHETATVLEPDGGDYRIVAVGIVGAVPDYDATVRFVLTPAQKLNTRLSNAIQFGPATFVNPTLFGGEPGINGDPSATSHWFIDWPIGTRQNMGIIARSIDGGDTWKMMTDPNCPNRRQPGCLTLGGGDTEVAISKDGTVFFSNQEALGNEAACVSPDNGITWPQDRCHAITLFEATTDRQWLAAYDENVGYLAASVTGGTALVRTTDGGKTWSSSEMPFDGEAPGSSGPIMVDRTGGARDKTLYMLTRAAGLSITVSRDGGKTFTSWPSTAKPKTGPCMGCNPSPLLIPWMTMDNAGNLYVAWSDDKDHAVWLTTMLASDPRNAGANLGSTWTTPVRVSIPPARSTVFTQVVAGDPGRIAVAYQGAETRAVSSDAAKGTPWHIYAAFSTDALCQWKATCKGAVPAFEQTQVSHRPNHRDEICVSGLGCTINGKNRDLADFFDVGVDNDGRVGITWSDDNHALVGPYIMFAKMVNGPSLRVASRGFRTQLPVAARASKGGDAVWPVNASGGRNYPTMDLLGTKAKLGGDALTLSTNVASTANLADGLGAGYQTQHVKYVTMWHYRDDLYFAAADTDGSAAPVFYGGKLDANDALQSPTNPGTDYGAVYVKDFDVTGRLENGVVSFDVPLSLVGSPKKGDTLHSVQSFVIAGLPDAAQTMYTQPDTIDMTPALDYTLGSETSVLGTRRSTTRGSVSRRTPLPATGMSDTTIFVGLLLLAASALTWRWVSPAPRR